MTKRIIGGGESNEREEREREKGDKNRFRDMMEKIERRKKEINIG